MGSWIRQMRVRYGSAADIQQLGINRERNISFQKTQDKKKVQSPFKISFNQRDPDDDPSRTAEHAAAIAAAAFAIKSPIESSIPEKKKLEGLEPSLDKEKSKKETTAAVLLLEPGQTSRRFSGESSMQNSDILDEIVPIDDAAGGMITGPAPSFGRKTDAATPRTKNQISTNMVETKADAWEKAELAKIKYRYGKLNGTITSWEENKRKKVHLQKERKEGELEGRRAKTAKHYHTQLVRIREIAEGAKASAEKRQGHEESKAREKANKMRMRAEEEPSTCSCFGVL